MGITREHVSRQDGEIYHRVLIRNFSDKMRNWIPGRLVRLRTVYVDSVPLRMKIYPNGEGVYDTGYVTCIIENLSDDKEIEIDFELRIKERSVEIEDFKMTPNTTFSSSQYFSHDNLLDADLYGLDENSDEALEIHWTIKTKSLQEKYIRLSEKYENLTMKFKRIEREMEDDKEKMVEYKQSMFEMLSVLHTYFSGLAKKELRVENVEH